MAGLPATLVRLCGATCWPCIAGVQTTMPRLVMHLNDFSINISKRQVVRLLNAGKDGFLSEAAGVLRVGLETASWITVDDTGARHRGEAGS